VSLAKTKAPDADTDSKNAQKMAFTLLLRSSLETMVTPTHNIKWEGHTESVDIHGNLEVWQLQGAQKDAGPVVSIHSLQTAGPSMPVPSRAQLFWV